MSKTTVKKKSKTLRQHAKTVIKTGAQQGKFGKMTHKNQHKILKIIKNLTSLEFKLDYKFINDTQNDSLFEKISNNLEPYTFIELDNKEQILNKIYEDKLNEFEGNKKNYGKQKKLINDKLQFLNDGFARSISRYINDKYPSSNKLSNAYIKLWEMYTTFKWLIPASNNEHNFFHMAEAPGQWINTTNTYFNKYLPQKEYKWYANSLNPNVKINGVIPVIKDDYGFIKKYSSKWLWGADNTGDITKPENIKWFGNYLKAKLGDINVITGDAGLPYDAGVKLMQKLELAQMVLVACISTHYSDSDNNGINAGSACVVKHFLPFMSQYKITKKACGLFMSIMYMYHLMFQEFHMYKPLSSSPNSGEFYVICRNFKGLSDDIKEKLLSLLDNFEVNKPFFAEKDIPITFKKRVIDFINILMQRRLDTKLSEYELLKCINKQPTNINCNYYLGTGFRKYKEADMEKYIKKYDLI